MKSNLTLILLFSLLFGIYGIIPSNLTNYAILAATAITNVGSTTLQGDIGNFPGTSVTGFNPPGTYSGVQVVPTVASNAQTNLLSFYTQLSNLNCTYNLTGIDLGARTLTPGVYCFVASATLTGILTFDSQNQTSPAWVFQIGTTLTTSGSSVMKFVNGTAPCNVFWNIGSSMTLGGSSIFVGVVNAYTSITVGSGSTVTGKLFVQNAAISLSSNTHLQCNETMGTSLVCSGKLSTDPTVCGTRGICVFNNTCACNQGFSGSNCGAATCNSKLSTDPTVCGSQGNCTGLNTCVCNSQYGGPICQFPVCNSILSNDSSVCSGQGTCASPNNCTCNVNYSGNQCQITLCYSKFSNDSTVCGGQGICTAFNNCVCNSTYGGNQCQLPICNGKLSTDSTVCGGQGNCSSPNNCTCNSNYGGNQCQSPICNGKLSTDSTVCGGQGNCSSPNNCTCNSNYGGNQCQFPICNGTLSTDSTVCSGQGTCSSPNNCSCNSNFGGNQCQFSICYGKLSTDPTVCSGQGTCIGFNRCACYPQANGTQCEKTTACQSDVSLAILAGTTITSTGISTVTGDAGIFPGITITGFPPGLITGNQYIATSVSQNSQNNLILRYGQLNGLPCGTSLTGQDLGGKTFKSGVYCFATTAAITGTLTLDGNNDPASFWIFQLGTALSTSVGSKITMINGGLACNVFWKVGSSASIGATSTFSGNVLALTSISLDTSASVVGKLLAQNGAVTMISNTVTNCALTCQLSCSGKLATDMTVCSGKGTCTFPGFCVCQNGTTGSTCGTTTRSNSSSTGAFSLVLLILSIFFTI